MNPFVKLLPVAHVVLDLEAGSKKRVFEQAGLLFENHVGIACSAVFDSLFAREKLGSTGLGQGIAIPHGRIKGLRQATGAFLKLIFIFLFSQQGSKEKLSTYYIFILQ